MNEKIAAALKSIEGATPGPLASYIGEAEVGRGLNPLYAGIVAVLAQPGGSDNVFVVTDRPVRNSEHVPNAERFALSPALGAALRLASAVEREIEVFEGFYCEACGHEADDESEGSLRAVKHNPGCTINELITAYDAFLAALPEAE